MREDLVDADGENRAVRSFLLLYGANPQTTIGSMRSQMNLSGWTNHPDWVNTEDPKEHLPKMGAQLWLRHLFSLENK